MPCERARDVRVVAHKVPQLPLLRVARVAVDKAVRYGGVVQQEGDRVDVAMIGSLALVGVTVVSPTLVILLLWWLLRVLRSRALLSLKEMHSND